MISDCSSASRRNLLFKLRCFFCWYLGLHPRGVLALGGSRISYDITGKVGCYFLLFLLKRGWFLSFFSQLGGFTMALWDWHSILTVLIHPHVHHVRHEITTYVFYTLLPLNLFY